MPVESDSDIRDGEVGYKPKVNEVSQNFLNDLEKERARLKDKFPLCASLINEAIDRIYSTGRIPGKELYADVLKQKPIKLIQKVFVPVKEFPTFNFPGKILGPKGNSLIRLQEETKCKIQIKGKRSMRDKAKENELRDSDDPRYNHLKKNLYLEISTVATPAECYARIAYALVKIRKYLTPDKNDEISHEQLREIMEIDPDAAKAGYDANPELYESVFGREGTSKYLGIHKRKSYIEREELEDENEYEQMVRQMPTKRISSSGNEVSSFSKGFMRTAVPTYAETKRVRGVLNKPYNKAAKA